MASSKAIEIHLRKALRGSAPSLRYPEPVSVPPPGGALDFDFYPRSLSNCLAGEQRIAWFFERRDAWNQRRRAQEFTPDFSDVDLHDAFRCQGKLNAATGVLPVRL